MRLAALRRSLEKLGPSNKAKHLRTAEFYGAPRIAGPRLDLANGLTVISGSNGVGKSSLLHAIHFSLCADDGEPVEDKKLHGLKALLSTKDEQRDLTVDDAGIIRTSTAGGEHLLIDLATDVMNLRTLANQSNFSDLLEGIGHRMLAQSELDELSELVSKRYHAAALYEIEGLNDDTVVPFFTVTTDGVTYSSPEMGQGELGAFFAWWHLAQATANSVILMDEPETHLSGASQIQLLGLMVKAINERGIQFIVTTHSQELLETLPRDCLRLVYRENGCSTIRNTVESSDIRLILGGSYNQDFLLLTEDRVAAHFLESILRKRDRDIMRRVRVASGNGNGDLEKLAKLFPQAPGRRLLAIVLDGDQHEGPPESYVPLLVLPGGAAPEQVLRRRFSQEEVAVLASRWSIDTGLLQATLSSIENMDHHDWIDRLVHSLAQPKDVVVSGLVDVWLLAGENAEKSDALVEKLRSVLDPE